MGDFILIVILLIFLFDTEIIGTIVIILAGLVGLVIMAIDNAITPIDHR